VPDIVVALSDRNWRELLKSSQADWDQGTRNIAIVIAP
jgi:hypothetical protein